MGTGSDYDLAVNKVPLLNVQLCQTLYVFIHTFFHIQRISFLWVLQKRTFTLLQICIYYTMSSTLSVKL